MAHPTTPPAAVNLESKSTLKADINSILPPEVLALAFTFPFNDAVDAISFDLPGGPDAAEVQRRFKQHPLWNASLVCRAWYGIIKNTRRFWTFVAFGFTSPAEPSESANDPPATATSCSPRMRPGKRLRTIEVLLQRSGRLPLTVVLCPENIQSLPTITHSLRKHFDRLEILSLVPSDNLEPLPRGRYPMPSTTTLFRALHLITEPMPKLKLLSFSSCIKCFPSAIVGRGLSVRRDVDAPELETLSCHTHLIVPKLPTRLSSLSLIKVDIYQYTQRSIELPNLVDLRIQDCDAGTILSTFLTPSLRRLVVRRGDALRNPDPHQLSRYDSLQELQWADAGHDPVFTILCRLCPNLQRYFNYIRGSDIEKDIKIVDTYSPMDFNRRPTILSVFDEDVLGGVNTSRNWPVLEEVSLDTASCDHVARLIKTVPSIKRVRILRNRVLSNIGVYQERERDKLEMLRGSVKIAIGGESWGSGSRRNESREVAVTL
ncbi:hypothetical protein FS837_002281 [Tulasnella sp. UAMH 9824]|nr:hypothetical protein FS837_002281 [Tulasnella sp. UAMH 9824]